MQVKENSLRENSLREKLQGSVRRRREMIRHPLLRWCDTFLQ